MINKIPIFDNPSDVCQTFQAERVHEFTSHFDIIDLSHASQTFRFASQSQSYVSQEADLSVFENTGGPAWIDFMLGLTAKTAPIYENGKENKQVSGGRNDIWEDDKHELCQLPLLKSLTALETVTGYVEEVRVTHQGGREPAVINKLPLNM